MEDRVYPAQNNGGYKGFSYSYPLQQPPSPPTPRRRRCGCGCCACCCWVLITILILLCIGAALVYFLMKPKAPTYSISQATIKQFNYSSQHHLTSDMQFVVSAQNPNKKVELYFNGLGVEASYQGADIADGTMAAFHQTRDSSLSLPVEVQGKDVVLRGSVASNLKKSLANKGSLQLQLNIKGHLKVKIGLLKSWGQIVKISCYLTISAPPSKPGKVQILSNSCKLKG